MFNTEEDLLVCLGIQEPDVTATLTLEDVAPSARFQEEETKTQPVTKVTNPTTHVNEHKPALKPILHAPVQKLQKVRLGNVIVLIPIGLPGMGKTVLYE